MVKVNSCESVNNHVGILLCGGTGSRLKPFTNKNNKVMVDVGDKKLLDFHMENFADLGITKLIIIINNFYEDVQDHMDNNYPSFDTTFVIEDEPRGTVHALSLAYNKFEKKQVILRFGDNYTMFKENEIQALRTTMYGNKKGATIITKVVSDPTQYGVCVFDDDGQIKRFIEKPLSPPSNIAIGGFFIFDDSFSTKLLYCNENSKSTIIDLLNAYKFNSKVQELRMNNFGWIDCGTTSGLNQLHRILETSEVSL